MLTGVKELEYVLAIIDTETSVVMTLLGYIARLFEQALFEVTLI